MADGELAARVRAAFAYKGLTKAQRAAALGVSVRTVSRYESGENDIDTHQLSAIAKATGVPEAFLANGFPNGDEPALSERLEALEQRYAALRPDETRRLVAEAVAALNETVARHTRELEELRAADRRRQRKRGNDR